MKQSKELKRQQRQGSLLVSFCIRVRVGDRVGIEVRAGIGVRDRVGIGARVGIGVRGMGLGICWDRD